MPLVAFTHTKVLSLINSKVTITLANKFAIIKICISISSTIWFRYFIVKEQAFQLALIQTSSGCLLSKNSFIRFLLFRRTFLDWRSGEVQGDDLSSSPERTLSTWQENWNYRRRNSPLIRFKKWWVWQDLNLRPHPYQGCTLTTWATDPIEWKV